MALWEFTTEAVSESQTSQSPILQIFPCCPVCVWLTARYCTGSVSHPARCFSIIAVLFPWNARKTNGTGEYWFVYCGDRNLVHPKQMRSIYNRAAQVLKILDTVWETEILSQKQSLALFTSLHQVKHFFRLHSAMVWVFLSISEQNQHRLEQGYWLCSSHGVSPAPCCAFPLTYLKTSLSNWDYYSILSRAL